MARTLMSKPISHAQFGEDLVLWRALSEVSKGFYIDVGAAEPDELSVTKLFYDRGWNGINIDPRPSAFKALSDQRQRDINLQIAVSDTAGAEVLHEVVGLAGLSTIDEALAQSYSSKGLSVEKYMVLCQTLASVCDEHVKGEIHFLKIDVEGAEKAVLQGCDFERFRPWLLVIESTIPCTDIPNYDHWEPLVFRAGYEFALFHAINRYYVAREQLMRLAKVAPPE